MNGSRQTTTQAGARALAPGIPHVVIVGCGVGGLAAPRRLVDRPMRVTMVDRAHHRLFQPLLHQVATGGSTCTAVSGEAARVAGLGRLKPSGYPAWLFWRFAPVVSLIGFRNRIVVMTDGASSKLSFERYARIIGGPPARR